jgi:uncharacterized protein (TIGR03663 family)
MSRRRWLAVAALLVLALVIRVLFLGDRPPHHDEGVNGWMVERIRELGYYPDQPQNFHGPAYFYLLVAARETFGFGLCELRITCAVIGAVLCAAPLLLRRRLGEATALVAIGVLATSPTLVYYARYAIHETLFAAFGVLVTLSVLRFSASGRARWLYLAGAALAGMIATKETTILFVGVLGLWLTIETIVESSRARAFVILGHAVRRRAIVHAIGVLAVMAAIHVAMFTGLFRDPNGVVDTLARSARAYLGWTEKGTGQSGHEKAWWYYLQLGLRYELVLYVLAAIGFVHGVRNREVRCLGCIGFGLAVLHSAIPYKMPWLPTLWLALLAIPAGRAVVVIARRVRQRWYAVAALASIPALALAVRASFVKPADASERLAYAHTSPDYNEWFGRIEAAGRARGSANVRVAFAHEVVWPLPWSLEHYARSMTVSGTEDVIIASPGRAAAIENKLVGEYYKRPSGMRNYAWPAFIYFRVATFSPWLAHRANNPYSKISIVWSGSCNSCAHAPPSRTSNLGRRPRVQ